MLKAATEVGIRSLGAGYSRSMAFFRLPMKRQGRAGLLVWKAELMLQSALRANETLFVLELKSMHSCKAFVPIIYMIVPVYL